MAVNGLRFIGGAGEIVGIAGVDGNGQSELIEAITGLRKAESWQCKIKWQRNYQSYTTKNY